MWSADNEGMALCCECAPTQFKDGEPTNYSAYMRTFGK